MPATTTILAPATLKLPDPIKKLRDLSAELNRVAGIIQARRENGRILERTWPEKPPRRPNAAWSEERRARQSLMMRTLQPWKKSTGPRTDAGKARSSRNGRGRDAGKSPDSAAAKTPHALHRFAILLNNSRLRALRRVERQLQRFYRCELKALAKLLKRGFAPANTSLILPPGWTDLNSSWPFPPGLNCATIKRE